MSAVREPGSDAGTDLPPDLTEHVWRSLGELYAEQFLPMVRLAVLLVGDESVAADLVQDAFVAVSRRWDSVRDPVPYLRRCVVNRCRSWGRRAAVERRFSWLHVTTDLSEDRHDEMFDAIAALPAAQRAVVVLRYYVDLPDAEIARLLGCRQTTVRTRLHRALNALRQEVTE